MQKPSENYHEQAYIMLHEAIDLETQKRLSEALVLYKRGISVLQLALEQKHDQMTTEKMKKNLALAEERLAALKKLQGKTLKENVSKNPSVKRDASRFGEKVVVKNSRKDVSKVVSNNNKLVGLNVDSVMANLILNEIVQEGVGVQWDDISGLEFAKQSLKESVILPCIRPELFTGLRSPATGVLMFGPPGKTMLAKAVASSSDATFFNMSASSLTSKYLGESEKLVKTLFALARHLAPSIVFIDEIDSLLRGRTEGEHEATRRLKTEFLLQFDGLLDTREKRVVVIGATNRPQEIDEAARRRFTKRIYIPLPDSNVRKLIFKKLLVDMNDSDINKIVKATEGFSPSDCTALAREAALEPIRSLGDSIRSVPVNEIRSITFRDVQKAFSQVKPSVDKKMLMMYEDWNKEFGSS